MLTAFLELQVYILATYECLIYFCCIFCSCVVIISPSGPIQGAIVGTPQVINCTVNVVSGVDSSSVIISWMGPGGAITIDSRVTISPITSSGNTYTSSLQFTHLTEGDEGTYTCNVMILKTNGSQSVELLPLVGKRSLYI